MSRFQKILSNGSGAGTHQAAPCTEMTCCPSKIHLDVKFESFCCQWGCFLKIKFVIGTKWFETFHLSARPPKTSWQSLCTLSERRQKWIIFAFFVPEFMIFFCLCQAGFKHVALLAH